MWMSVTGALHRSKKTLVEMSAKQQCPWDGMGAKGEQVPSSASTCVGHACIQPATDCKHSVTN